MRTVEEAVAANLGGASAAYIVRWQWPGPWWGGNPEGIPATLGGSPLAVADLRTMRESADEHGDTLWVDNTIATSAGCAALRLGADVVLESLAHACGESGEGLAVFAVRRGARVSLPGEAVLSSGVRDELARAYAAYLERRRQECDAAQAIAAYLVCHPRVAHVWYPGLLRDQADSSRPDPANALAPSILTGGFGPVLDYATVDAPDMPIRHVADASDPIAQIERLEATLR